MATIDLIKSYLVGIGFKVDEDSFNKANSSMDNAEQNIKKFNESNQKGFSESSETLRDLFSLFNTFSRGVSELTPGLRTPFQNMINDILVLVKLYSKFNEQIKKKADNSNIKTSNAETKGPTANQNTSESGAKGLATIPKNELQNVNLVEQVLNAKNATKELAEEGTANIVKFSLSAVTKFALVGTAIVGVVAGIAKLVSGISNLAKQDIENEKLSRQLWTTKENAKEVDMAMKTLGVSMQDLWLSPTLLKQFNQLRQDSKELKLPREYTDNLKVIQGIGLEFSRLKQLGSLAFQWIGNYILKYAAGPLNDLRETVRSFNEWIIKNIPNAGKVIGEIVGVLIKIVAIILKIGVALFKLASPIFGIIKLIGQINEEFDKLPEPTKKTIKSIIAILVLLTSPLLLILALLDDVMTYFKGGKSVTGTFLDKLGKGAAYLEEKVRNLIAYLKELKKEIMNSSFVKGVQGALGSIKAVFNDPSKNDNLKNALSNANANVNNFSNTNMNNKVSNYTTSSIRNESNSSTTTQNSHNSIKNDNKIYVYSGNDANVTAKTVNKNLNGITLRSLQGGY
ncbi:hypothetical protein [Candidatus Clostridium helianthi]|uniref:Uncharacterized protein n=1 Tax=Candidatus Clostridium helianthi TaxID=3381660 RepID=A0ABW8SB54_9CLOT